MRITLLKKTQKNKKTIHTDSVGNEENGHPVPVTKKTMINVTKDINGTHKKPSKTKSWNKSLRNSWRRQ
jgi:hypothetical protein